MQYYTVTTDPMLLEYSLMASQSPVTVSPPQGDPMFVTLTFIISKPKATKDVQVSAINFTFPYGTGASDLTTDPIPESSASISTTGTDKWQIRQGIKPGMFTAKPESDGPVMISDQSLTITFARLQVNRVVGTADVTIVELATTGSGDPTPRKHTKHVPKFPPQFFVTDFSPTKPLVKHNERATLLWQGSAEADYLMLWGDGPPENVSGKNKWESPGLTSTTTFMLQVTAQSDGETVTHRAVATVIVENPNLVATDLRIGGTRLGYNDPPNDREFMLYNDDGSDSFPGKYGGVYIGNKAALLRLTDAGKLGLTTPGPAGTWFTLANTSKAGTEWGLASTGESNAEGAGHLLFQNGVVRMILAANGNVGIGTASTKAKLQITDVNQDPKGGTLVLGPGNLDAGVTLRLGCQAEYSWVQAHGAKPLAVNPIGNNVGIGTTTPQNALDVKGGVVIGATYAGAQQAPGSGLKVEGPVILGDSLTVQNDLTVRGNIVPPDAKGVSVHGDLHATGRLSSWNPIDVYFPEKNKWYRMAIGYNDYAWFDNSPFSDICLKEDMRPIRGALDKVMRLQGMLYRWSENGLNVLTRDVVSRVSAGPGSTEQQHEALRQAERQKAVEKLSGDHIGLIAQEVEAVVPEAVSKNEDGHKCVRYPQLVALLVEAIKEQGAQIQALSSEVSALAERVRGDKTL
jgi:hypothetical protein